VSFTELLKGEPFAVKGEAFGKEIAVAKARNLGAELTEAKPSAFGIPFVGDQGLGGGGQMNGNPVGEFGGERTGEIFVTEGVLVSEVLYKCEGPLLLLPLAEAAFFPFGEIDGVDGVAFKVGFENGLGFRQRVEPGKEGFGLVAILEALVELFANEVRQTGDFSGSGHGISGLMDS